LRSFADAEDVVGEVFYVVTANKDKYAVQAKFSTWLYTIAHNICIDNGYISKDLKIGEIENHRYIINDPPDLIPEDITKKTYLMNLDVNFVNNRRMKIGDYRTAANCFQEVIKGYSNHAFAYHYLGKCQEAMKEDQKIIDENINRFYDIIDNDRTWKDYTEYFDLDLTDSRKA